MGKHGKTRFQDQWLSDTDIGSWLRRVPVDVYSAACTLCPGSIINVSTMGRQALISHKKSKKHQMKERSNIKQPALRSFISQCPSTSGPPLCQTTSASRCATQTVSSVSIENEIINPAVESLIRPSSENSKTQSSSMNKFILNDEVTKAEITWALHSVNSHRSHRAAAKYIKMLKCMFPQNEVIQKMQLERTKIGYIIVFGLAPYFKSQLLSDVNKASHFVIGFDESLNKVSQSQQMDFVIRYWNEEKNEVTTRYLTSAFLKRATAADLMTAFLASVDCLNLGKLIQISMDGPNVNKKFLRDLEDYLYVDLKFQSKLISIGSCGLHTLHCAFKAAITLTGWDIVSYLRAVYNFFKDHPARRGMFTNYTGSHIFPKKFCSIRWLENEDVAENAINMIPYLKEYLNCLNNNKEAPQTRSFQVMEEKLKNPLLGAQLAFFRTLALDMRPLMTEFQSNLPLSPFLYTSLRNLLLKEMERFLKPEKVSVNIKVLKKSENFLPASKINIGVGAKCEIGKCHDKISQLQAARFRHECGEALKCLVERILDRSPLQHEATKYISSIDPNIAVSQVGQERFENLIILLTNHNWLSSQSGERALEQFKALSTNSDIHDKLKCFKRKQIIEGQQKNIRLDSFWMDVLSKSEDNIDLKFVIKQILVLSHCNAAVERGFSINKECLLDNMKEESLIATRTVYDAISHEGDVGK